MQVGKWVWTGVTAAVGKLGEVPGGVCVCVCVVCCLGVGAVVMQSLLLARGVVCHLSLRLSVCVSCLVGSLSLLPAAFYFFVSLFFGGVFVCSLGRACGVGVMGWGV